MSIHCHSASSTFRNHAFSLIELLSVMAVLAVLSVLLMPAMSSLQARNLVLGGNTVTDLAQHARQNSMSKGVLSALVMLGDSPSHRESSNRAFVVVELAPGAQVWRPVSRWIRLPVGVSVDKARSAGFAVSPAGVTPLNLPSLDGNAVSPTECIYQIFTPAGALMTSSAGTTPSSPGIYLFEGFALEAGQVTKTNPSNYYNVVINRFTGVTKVDRP